MKTLKILEVMWFTIAFVSFSIGVFKLVTESFTESISYFIITLLALAFGFIRKKQRTNSDKNITH
jgi:hypothetical protein